MTVADLISDALKILGVTAAGEAPSAEDQSDAFRALNRMVESWANDKLLLYTIRRDGYSFTPGQNPHHIGPGLLPPDFDATRPVHIERASVIPLGASGVEIPLRIVSDAEWQRTQGKNIRGTPTMLWPRMSFPTVELWFNPIPANADTLVLYTMQQIDRFDATSDTFSMPPGYEEAIIYNLALRIAPPFGAKMSEEAMLVAAESLASLRRANTKPMYATCDAAIVPNWTFNIIAGDQ